MGTTENSNCPTAVPVPGMMSVPIAAPKASQYTVAIHRTKFSHVSTTNAARHQHTHAHTETYVVSKGHARHSTTKTRDQCLGVRVHKTYGAGASSDAR